MPFERHSPTRADLERAQKSAEAAGEALQNAQERRNEAVREVANLRDVVSRCEKERDEATAAATAARGAADEERASAAAARNALKTLEARVRELEQLLEEASAEVSGGNGDRWGGGGVGIDRERCAGGRSHAEWRLRRRR